MTAPAPSSRAPLARAPHAPAPPGRVRVRLDLAYDGAGFSGWAAQPGLRTVEGELGRALATVVRHPVQLTVAGRTDAGVHAAAQTAHVDVDEAAWLALPGRSQRPSGRALRERLTGVLARQAGEAAGSGRIGPLPRGAADVVVHRAALAPPGFDARFSALSRRYVYRVADAASGPAGRDPLRRGAVLWMDGELDVAAMAAASEPLVGEHDFLSFCRPRRGATTIRTLKTVRWRREESGPDAGLVVLVVVADAFCHSMVRSLAGAGLAVGRGRRDADWPARLLAARSRDSAAPVAPAHALTLAGVSYPPDDRLGERAELSRALRSLPADRDCGC